MDWKYLFTGIGLLLAAYFIYRQLRKRGPASERNNGVAEYFSCIFKVGGAFVLCAMAGVVLVFKSFTA